MDKPFLEVSVVRADTIKKVAMMHPRMHADYRATLATSLIAPFSHIAIDDGETSVGRQKQRIQTPQELTDRVIATTELLLAAFEQRGWLVEVPPLSTTMEDDRPATGFGGGN